MEDASNKLENNRTKAGKLYPNPFGVLGYVRVSTLEQAAKGKSLEDQKRRIKAYAEAKNLDLMAVIVEASSAMPDKTHKRKGFMNIVRNASTYRLGIVVTSIDRLTRSREDAETLITKELSVHVVDLGCIASQEQLRRGTKKAEKRGRQIQKSTSDAMKTLKASGAKTGPSEVPENVRSKGAQSNRQKAEAAARRVAAVLLRHSGPARLKHREVAEILNQLGARGRQGDPNNASQVRRYRKRAEEMIAEARKTPGGLEELLRGFDEPDILFGSF